MSYIDSVDIYQGAQSKFYIVDGEKYHIRFPMEWAHDHRFFPSIFTNEDGEEITVSGGTGPNQCGNCKAYGSIRDVFVGYCCGCLEYYYDDAQPRGELIAPGMALHVLGNQDIWMQYPYMYGIKKSEIGDIEGAVVNDIGVDLEMLAHVLEEAHAHEYTD
jgi:hypothetical protein